MSKIFLFIVPLFILISCNEKPKVTTASPSTPASVTAVAKTFKTINVQQALLTKGTILLDVRTPEEVAQGQIPNSISLDYKNDNFSTEVNKLDKTKDYIVYCRSGNRSAKASKIMLDLGFQNITNMEGGFNKYKEIVK